MSILCFCRNYAGVKTCSGFVVEISILNQKQQIEIPACNWFQDLEFDWEL